MVLLWFKLVILPGKTDQVSFQLFLLSCGFICICTAQQFVTIQIKCIIIIILLLILDLYQFLYCIKKILPASTQVNVLVVVHLKIYMTMFPNFKLFFCVLTVIQYWQSARCCSPNTQSPPASPNQWPQDQRFRLAAIYQDMSLFLESTFHVAEVPQLLAVTLLDVTWLSELLIAIWVFHKGWKCREGKCLPRLLLNDPSDYVQTHMTDGKQLVEVGVVTFKDEGLVIPKRL